MVARPCLDGYNNNNNNKSLFQANHWRQWRPIFKVQYTYDTNIDKIQIHNTDPNVCHMNSKKTDKKNNMIKNYWRQLVLVYRIDSQRLHIADDSRQDETVAATIVLSLLLRRCIKPYSCATIP